MSQRTGLSVGRREIVIIVAVLGVSCVVIPSWSNVQFQSERSESEPCLRYCQLLFKLLRHLLTTEETFSNYWDGTIHRIILRGTWCVCWGGGGMLLLWLTSWGAGCGVDVSDMNRALLLQWWVNECLWTVWLQPSVSMNKEKEKPLLEGQEFSLTCQSRLPSHGLLEFRWFKDHVLIREDYTTRWEHAATARPCTLGFTCYPIS